MARVGAQPSSTDHPRMRGEHSDTEIAKVVTIGSPPHARGAPVVRLRGPACERITPACAGSTRYMRMSACGDPGSPPHARGAHTDRLPEDSRRWITPACAGSTSRARTPAWTTPDHPRMRGEHPCGPRTRGPGRDHPRMRGEHPSSRASTSISSGSPPHARGARPDRPFPAAARRITPACAGSTARLPVHEQVEADHPRMRGEHQRWLKPQRPFPGSPPHARGAPEARSLDAPGERITPACAGSTAAAKASLAPVADHPRMRGEHVTRTSSAVPGGGSPPHARGAPHRYGGPCPGDRITPACAGSTR